MIHGSIPARCKRFFSSPKHTHWLWGSPILLFNRYLGYFWGLSSRDANLNTYLHLVLRWRMSGAAPLLPAICLCGVDRNNFTFFTCTLLFKQLCWYAQQLLSQSGLTKATWFAKHSYCLTLLRKTGRVSVYWIQVICFVTLHVHVGDWRPAPLLKIASPVIICPKLFI
jgi:hypothetical protein